MKRPTLFSLVALALVLAIGASSATAEGAPSPEAAPAKAAKKAKKDALPSIDETVEDMERIDGFVTLYKKKDRLLALLSNDQLGKEMLMATSIAGGSQLTGFQWSDMMLRFERHDKKVLVIRPETRFGTGKTAPITSSVKRTHPGFLVGSLSIVAEDPKRGVVVSLSDLYSKQATAFVGDIAKGRDASLARLASVKNFPQNTEVALNMAAKPKGMDHGDILTIHYSLSSLPSNDYVPRIADNRLGYFLTVAKDYTRDYREDSTFVRYVNRWHLEKADPSLDLSPPKEPIIFYIEDTVPTRYRRHVREGILEWNKAFERIGFVDAVEVRQQTETQFADLDPEDVRYNFFRWITSDWAFAMGPSRVDPRTGQILDADILFDDAMVRAYMDDWDLLIEEAMMETRSPSDREYLQSRPERDPIRFLRSAGSPGTSSVKNPLARIAELKASSIGSDHNEPFGSGRDLCSIGRGRARQMALASLYLQTLATTGPEGGDEPQERVWPEEFVGQIIKETVLHEVGHTLGLRHNFKSSTWRPFRELHAHGGEYPEDLAGSVMDYNPINLAPEGLDQGLYQMTTLGPYDYWVIEYGYTPTGASSPEGELDKLAEIAKRGAEDGHDYATDEDIWLGDPLTNRWDFGKEPLDYAKSQVAIAQSLKNQAIDRLVSEGESYDAARKAINMLFGDIGHAGYLASRYVGGTYFHRDHRGDPESRDPIVVVPAEKQREALQFVTKNVFDAGAFDLPSEVVRKLAPSRWSHWGTSSPWGTEAAYPYYDRVLAMQMWSLTQLMSPSTMERIANIELATEDRTVALTLPELFSTLTGSIFGELGTASGGNFSNGQPMLNGVRRNLQREYVAMLIDLTLDAEKSAYPRAARTLAWYELKKLNDELGTFLGKGTGKSLDDYSRAHLEETKERVFRALDASFELRS